MVISKQNTRPQSTSDELVNVLHVLPSKEQADRVIRLWALSLKDPASCLDELRVAARDVSGLCSGESAYDMAMASLDTFKGVKKRVKGYDGQSRPIYESALTDCFVTATGVASMARGKSAIPKLDYHDNLQYVAKRLAGFAFALKGWDVKDQENLAYRYMNWRCKIKHCAENLGVGETRLYRLVSRARKTANDIMQGHLNY